LGFRNFIETLDKSGELTRITKPVSTEYELAGIISALGEKPVYFEKVKESSYPVVAGLVSSKKLIAQSLGIDKEQLLPKLSAAIEHPAVHAEGGLVNPRGIHEHNLPARFGQDAKDAVSRRLRLVGNYRDLLRDDRV
jgi:hypothetical protein